MSTETTNKKIKIDNGTTFGRTYTDKAIDAKLPTDLIASANKLSLGVGNTALGNGVNLDGFTYDEATKTLKASGGGSGIPTIDATFSEDSKFIYSSAINSDIFIANLKDYGMKALLTHYSMNIEDTKMEFNIGLLNEAGLPCLIQTTADDSGNVFDTLVQILTAPLNFSNGLVYHGANGIQSLSNGQNNQILSMQSGTPTWINPKKEAKPILNLMGLNGAKRTTITAEERTNFYAGLYSGVYYYDKDLGITEDSLYFPEIIKGSSEISIYKVTRKYTTDTAFSFIPVGIVECGITISYDANSDGTYNFTIKKYREIPIDYGSPIDVTVQQVDAYGEGGASTIEKGKVLTDLTGVDLKVPFVLNIYEDSTLSGTPTRIVMTNKIGEIYLGNFDFINNYLVQMTKGTDGKYSYASSIVPSATKNTLFNKPILVPEDAVAPTPILPCTAADNGKVLSVVNGEAQWTNAGGGGGSTKLYQHNIILTENSISEYLYFEHISSKQSEVANIADLNALLGTGTYTFKCSGEVKMNNTWYNAVAIYWDGSYANSSVLYNVPGEGEKTASLTTYTGVADTAIPID